MIAAWFYILLLLFALWLYVVLMSHSWFCSQESLLVDSGDHKGLGIEYCWATCKASTLPCVLCLQPNMVFLKGNSLFIILYFIFVSLHRSCVLINAHEVIIWLTANDLYTYEYYIMICILMRPERTCHFRSLHIEELETISALVRDWSTFIWGIIFIHNKYINLYSPRIFTPVDFFVFVFISSYTWQYSGSAPHSVLRVTGAWGTLGSARERLSQVSFEQSKSPIHCTLSAPRVVSVLAVNPLLSLGTVSIPLVHFSVCFCGEGVGFQVVPSKPQRPLRDTWSTRLDFGAGPSRFRNSHTHSTQVASAWVSQGYAW